MQTQTGHYLDYNATAPLRPEALEAMKPWLGAQFGNPSSTHQAGQRARAAVEGARARLAKLLNCSPSGIFFTSGGTEAINLALRGSTPLPCKLFTSPTEHPAVLRTMESLAAKGDADLCLLPVDGQGQITELPLEPGLVSIMHANNETGVLHPIAQFAEKICGDGSIFHCDATQSFGKLKLDMKELGVELLSASSHKFGGPQGVGFLYKSDKLNLVSQMTGGEQEWNARAGTENVAGIVGMVTAAELAYQELDRESARVAGLRDRLEAEILRRLPWITVNGGKSSRIHNTLSLLIPGIESDLLVMQLDSQGIQVSAGSACSAGAVQSSHVLTAMGYSAKDARSGLRLSLGWASSEADVDAAVKALGESLKDLRNADI